MHDDGSRDMEWYAADGTAMGDRWDDPAPGWCRCTSPAPGWAPTRRCVVVNGGAHEHEVTLPAAPGVTAYRLLWDSDDERPQPAGRAAAARAR